MVRRKGVPKFFEWNKHNLLYNEWLRKVKECDFRHSYYRNGKREIFYVGRYSDPAQWDQATSRSIEDAAYDAHFRRAEPRFFLHGKW